MDITIYADGSGAPAVVMVKGWKFALDFLGEVKGHLISQSSSSKPPTWAAEHAKKMYLTVLKEKVSPEWFEMNRVMYEK